MDNIRLVLKTLFISCEAKTLLGEKQAVNARLKREDIVPLANWEYHKIFREMMGRYERDLTYDQLSTVVQEVQEIWLKPSDDTFLQFSNADSVFNILLHFSKEILRLIGDTPTCSYRHLLRWQDITSLLGEDLFVTSYLASRDLASCVKRTDFLWSSHLDHDNSAVNSILRRDLSELHAHLSASSDVFDLNWLFLMNCHEESKIESYVTLAAIIRVTLYEWLNNYKQSFNNELIAQMLDDKSDEVVLDKYQYLKTKVTSLHQDAFLLKETLRDLPDGICVVTDGTVIDYAIGRDSVNIDIESGKMSLLTLYSGERELLYSIFRHIYGEDIPSFLEYIFLIYLQLKTRYRNTIVEGYGHIGYTSFSEFEKNGKSVIRNKNYKSILNTSAIGGLYSNNNGNRYLEVRIHAKGTAEAIEESIQKIENSFRRSPFFGCEKWNPYYILSISKNYNKEKKKGSIRNGNTREDCEKAVKAINKLIKSPREEWHKKIVGIDACGSEFHCRPEVFAQAYRYIDGIYTGQKDAMTIRRTYHVGEDYYDVVDGLRAIDEVIRFLQFGNGTRIGHALALGENVVEYYKKRHYTIAMPLQVLVDNIAWLYHESALVCHELQPLRNILSQRFDEVYHKLTKGTHLSLPTVTIDTYYKSWTLRGDAPALYEGGVYDSSKAIAVCRNEYDRYSLNPDTDARNTRQGNKDAVALYWEYHHNEQLRNNGDKTEEWKMGEKLPLLIDAIREQMLEKVEKSHIVIECAPTSNIKIGGLKRYDCHPITKFFNFDINTPFNEHGITVSINTDDKGVFSTSLEREYSLMALALEKCTETDKKNSPRRIYDWLERVRQMGNESRFHI